MSSVQKFVLVPSMIGAAVGGPYCAYHQFNETKHKCFAENLVYTFAGLNFGFIYGGSVGLFWPISSFVFIGRLVDKKKD